MSNIRKARKAQGLTLLQVQADLGVDTGNMSRIERGVQVPSITIARQLAEYYSLSLEQVFAVDVSTDNQEQP